MERERRVWVWPLASAPRSANDLRPIYFALRRYVVPFLLLICFGNYN